MRADGWNYSIEAARAGAARSYIYGGNPVSLYDEIKAAEQEARNAPRGLWAPPCNGDTASTAIDTGNTSPPPALPAADIPPPSSSAYYDDCDAARAAGAAPLRAGEPGYRAGLDGDRDGVACEK